MNDFLKDALEEAQSIAKHKRSRQNLKITSKIPYSTNFLFT